MISFLISLGISALLIAAYWGFRRLTGKPYLDPSRSGQVPAEFDKLVRSAPDQAREQFRRLMLFRNAAGGGLVAGLSFLLLGGIAKDLRVALIGWFLWIVCAFTPLLIDGVAALILDAAVSRPLQYVGEPRIILGDAAIRFGRQHIIIGLICLGFGLSISIVAARAIL